MRPILAGGIKAGLCVMRLWGFQRNAICFTQRRKDKKGLGAANKCHWRLCLDTIEAMGCALISPRAFA